MSQSELAQVRRLSRRSLNRHIADLETLGYLTIHRRPGQVSNYRLTSKGRQLTSPKKPNRMVGLLGRILDRPSGETDLGSSELESPRDDTIPPTRTVGREEILATLHENATKRRHTLLIGPLGIGKSHILRHFATQLEQRSKGAREQGSGGAGEKENPKRRPELVEGSEIRNPKFLYLEHVSPIKPALLTLAQRLHADGNLAVEGIEANYMEWEDVRKKIAPLRVNQLADLLIKCMTDRNYVLLLDHLERVTPTMLPHLDALMDVAVVIAATDELKPSAQRLWWAFERVEVPPLPRDQARELLWQVADRDRVANSQLFETRVLQQAGGNPLAIVTMAGKAAPRGADRGGHAAALSAQEIRGLRHGAGVRYVSLTPALMLIGALIVAARFVALGLDDRDLYVLAGLGYASFFFMRYFIYRID